MAPDLVAGLGRFVAQHVQRGAGQVVFVEQGQQVVFHHLFAAPHVDEVGATRQQGQGSAVQQVARLGRERQGADQDVAGGQQLLQTFGTAVRGQACNALGAAAPAYDGDRKSTRLNSSHLVISYAVFCLKKKKKNNTT